MILSPGTVLYKYQLKRCVGKGHFGEVWLAHDLTISRDVAVKVLDASMAPAALGLREAQVGNRLNHQNVVKVHYADVCTNHTNNVVLIAMDYHPAGSIMSLLNPGNFVVMRKAVSAITDVLRGLEYLHNQHIFHNDIKPSNILIGPQQEALLTDYGISCFSPGLLPVPAPNSYSLHIAPETLTTNTISVTTDVYQVGLTLFRLINGIGLVQEQKQKVGEVQFELLKARGKVPAAEDYMPFSGADINRVIRKATDPDPSKRFQSAVEMRRALEKIKYYGYWDCEPTGELFGIYGKYKYTFSTHKSKSGFEMTAYKESDTGRTTRVSKFSSRGLSNTDFLKLKKNYFLAILTGTI